MEERHIRTTIRDYVTEQKVRDKIMNENFWKWFGDSKITENGVPLVVYHQSIGGDNTFTEFKPKSFGSFGENSMFYFAKDKNWIRNYIKRFDSTQLSQKPRKFYLRIENPLDLKGVRLTPKEWIEFLKERNLLTDLIEEKLMKAPGRNELFSWIIYRYDHGEFVNRLKSSGYDGIIQDDSNYGRSNDVTTYVAISPGQIKSVENDGSWDVDDNNIFS